MFSNQTISRPMASRASYTLDVKASCRVADSTATSYAPCFFLAQRFALAHTRDTRKARPAPTGKKRARASRRARPQLVRHKFPRS